MPLLVTLLVFLLQFEGSICAVARDFFYSGFGEDVVLSCPLSPSDPHFGVNWRYGSNSQLLVVNGTLMETSSRAARLSVNSKGSLVIKKVTTSDGGNYRCWFDNPFNIIDNLLCVLSISPSPPDAECKKNKLMDLKCSLMCPDLFSCPEGSIVWLNESGNVLQEKTVELNADRSCVSVLTVNRLVGNYRRYSCQFNVTGEVKTEVHYTPVFSDSTDWSPLSYILLVLRITGLILMIGIIVVVYIRTKESKKSQKDVNVHFVCRDGSLNYENAGVQSPNPVGH